MFPFVSLQTKLNRSPPPRKNNNNISVRFCLRGNILAWVQRKTQGSETAADEGSRPCGPWLRMPRFARWKSEVNIAGVLWGVGGLDGIGLGVEGLRVLRGLGVEGAWMGLVWGWRG